MARLGTGTGNDCMSPDSVVGVVSPGKRNASRLGPPDSPAEPHDVAVHGGVLFADAMISPCGVYRYRLRRWDGPLQDLGADDWLVVVGLNPSIADANVDDPTVRRCRDLARRLDKRGLWLVNVYGLRSVDPRALASDADPVGPGNDDFVREALSLGTRTVAAWGKRVDPLRAADVAVLSDAWECLGTNLDGSPKHPLYVPRDRELRPWAWGETPEGS